MANSILLLGESGTGKSTSLLPNKELGIKGLNPKETFIINVKGKPLPARGWAKYYTPIDLKKEPKEGNYLASTNPDVIVKVLNYIGANRPDIKNVVLDDYIYILTQSFIGKALETGFQKFSLLAKAGFDVIDAGISMPENKNFIVISHNEENNGKTEMKLLGKLLTEKINIPGMFTYTLSTNVEILNEGKTKYSFATNIMYDDRGILVMAKTPYGVFKDLLIPNDLGLVIEEIDKFNKGE